MACYSPMKGYVPLSNLDGGKLVFNSRYALNPDRPISLPCGGCIGCRLDKTGDWAMRCMHEAQMHEQNCFITLTYADELLPEDYSVHVRTFQLFMKRLRKFYEPKKIRFYACGEYGPKNLRPHYHSILFNHDFPDKQFYQTTPQGNRLYTSTDLQNIWGFGFVTIGDVTYQSAGYCAQYVMKKINGDLAATHYLRTHPVTQQIVTVDPEFQLSSTNPGLGATWFEKYKSDCFPSDFLVVDGKQHRVPAYYTRKLIQEDQAKPAPTKLAEAGRLPATKIKRARKKSALPQKWNNTKERLAVRETIKKERIKSLKREL
ncbi:replication initiator protein [Blackfly microvirus SF02]|uniref:Replication initiator protein n=1 Tax=Blackfly microvirus SF02 TaxID=2576452 RepID=A0A4P8PLY5_9VIRU|nr:replication initiator protein [Blackfly microvirus SF02]